MKGPVDPRIEQPLRNAQQALDRADWKTAAKELERAAAEAQALGDGVQAARCLQMAATLHRATGGTSRAIAAASRAERAGGDDLRARFAGEAEKGEALAAAGNFSSAAEAYRAALALGERLALPPWARATLLRRRADALAGQGELDSAWREYDAAAAQLIGAGDLSGAAWLSLEHANRAWQAGALDHAHAVAERADLHASAADDPHLRSERALLLARLFGSRGDYTAAASRAESARAAALEAVAPLSYFGAAVALAQALEAAGDRVRAYAVLATAWVTLADLLGDDVAGSWVGPVLAAYRAKWGTPEFTAVKAAHDRSRREALRRD